MANDGLNRMELTGIPNINSYTPNLASGIQTQIEEFKKRTHQIGEEVYNNRQRMQNAIEQTAINTCETNVQLQKVVENQNSFIDVLKDQLSAQKQQLDLDEQQLTILKNIFESGEDGVAKTSDKHISRAIRG
jgi:hypothetical protein